MFLARFAVEQLGVSHRYANVTQVKLAENGDIAAIDTDRAGTIEGDLFVDCSGFRSLLLGEALGIGFHSVADTLLADTAIAMQVPWPSEASPIPCTTMSTAQDAGWIWDISLYHRRGVGHVFSSNHMSADDAEASLRRYIGPVAEGLSARRITMPIGYREKFWHRNCVAIGLSAAFVEPLEASAIFLVEAAGNMIADMFPRSRDAMVHVERQFNESFQFRWQRTIEFIKLHYLLSQRQTPFWRDNQAATSVPDTLAARLDYWRHQPVSRYQFANVFEPFPQESYQYVMYGMGIQDQGSYSLQALPERDKAHAHFAQVKKASELINRDLPRHRELLQKVYEYGFQTI